MRAQWFLEVDKADARRVAWTEVGCYAVSTVFTGVDCGVGDSVPLVFETMTFRQIGPWPTDDLMNPFDGKWASWIEAESSHNQAVEFVRGLMAQCAVC